MACRPYRRQDCLPGVGLERGARSYESALILNSIVALTQGGAYTPSIMLVADEFPPQRRGRAIGAIQAAASLGYLVSILVSFSASSLLSYEWGFYASAIGPLLGSVAGWLALTHTANIIHGQSPPAPTGASLVQALTSRRSVLLTIGYTAHAWELLGMWAWTPTFFAAAFRSSSVAGSAIRGLWIAAPIHLSGLVATLTMGEASDRWGRRGVLVSTALSGAILSLTFGWLIDFPLVPLLVITFVYGFAVLGDSGVLAINRHDRSDPFSLSRHAARPAIDTWIRRGSPIATRLRLDPRHHKPDERAASYLGMGVHGARRWRCHSKRLRADVTRGKRGESLMNWRAGSSRAKIRS